MKDKQNETRIVISEELNQKLLNLEKELKAKGFKGITRKKLFTDLCLSGLEFQKQSDQGMQGFTSTSTGVKKPIAPKAPYVIETDLDLGEWQRALSEKENRLMNRELQLNVREEFLNRKQTQYYIDKEQLIIDQAFDTSKIPSGQLQKDEMKSLIEAISNLEKENKLVHKEMETLLKKIDKNTKEDVLKDVVLPLVSLALSAYLIYLNKNATKESISDPQIRNIIELLSDKSPKEKEKVQTEIKSRGKKQYPAAPKVKNDQKSTVPPPPKRKDGSIGS